MKKTPKNKTDEIIRIRKEERLSLSDISARAGVERGVVARILKDHPLSKLESLEAWRDKVVGSQHEKVKIDLTGWRFWRLLVIKRSFKPSGKHETYWECVCDCGVKKNVASSHLRIGSVRSCGCYSRDAARARNQKCPYAVNYSKAVHSYRCSALARGLKFDLTYDQCECLFKQPCIYCGLEPQEKPATHKNKEGDGRDIAFFCGGIDRAGSSKGYTLDNSVPCCTFCNYAKRDKSVEEFLEWAKRIHIHQSKGGGRGKV